MPRTLSSAWTFFYKFLLPVLLIAVFAVGFRSALEARGAYSGTPSASPPVDLLALGLVVLVALVAVARTCVPLKRVRLGDDGETLLVSNYFQEWKVPAGLITSVRQNRWLKLRPVTLHLRIDPGCGTRVTFMPPVRINFLFWREDPVVEELRALASMHVPV
jgi:hypothetical protein